LPSRDGFSAVEPTLDDDDTVQQRSRRRDRVRALALVVLCFLGGAAVVALAAVRLGYLGSEPSTSSAAYAERAAEALRVHRWDSPPGDNVRDITDEGLRRHPGDHALLHLRTEAAEELVEKALGRKYAGDVDDASRLARLASELDPRNTTAQHLVRELAAMRGDAAGGDVPAAASGASASRDAAADGARGARAATPASSSSAHGRPPSSSQPATPDSASPPGPGRWL
jgi:hypothetical protein